MRSFKKEEGYIKDEEKYVKDLEDKIGVPKGFTMNLLKQDNDWSFIVKLHSFLEAACTQLIITSIGKKELIDIISRVEMNEKKKGKIAYIRKLSLLEKRERAYINKLSEIRNFYVHNIKNISLSLEDYIKNFNADQLKSFIKAMECYIKEHITIKDKTIDRDIFIKDNPRVSIWLNAHRIILHICLIIKKEESDIKLQDLDEDYRKLAEDMMSLMDLMWKSINKKKKKN